MSILKKKKLLALMQVLFLMSLVCKQWRVVRVELFLLLRTFMSKLYFAKAIPSLLLMGGLSATYTRTEKVALVAKLSQLKNPRKVV